MSNVPKLPRMAQDYWSWLAGQIVSMQRKLDSLTQSQIKEGATIMTIQDDINNLVAAVADETNIVTSVQTLLSELTTLINNLKGQTTDPAAVAALEQAVTALQANNKAITDAVTANTPAP